MFIDGGAGIDLLLAGDAVANTLDSLLANTSTENGPIVNNVEALVTGSAIGKLTDAASLESYGITFTDANQDGNAEAVELTAFDASTSTGLMQADNGSFEHITNNSVDLTMDIASMPEDQNSAELQAIMFQLSTTPS